MQSGEALLVPHIDDAFLQNYSTSSEHERFMREMGYRSMMVVPLQSRTQGVLGTLSLIRAGSGPAYDQNDLRFACDLGRRCGMAIAKSLLHAQTLHIATQFQRAALPVGLPTVSGIAFDAFYEPSTEEMLVGGDWYDAFQLPDERIAITVGDVVGHGLGAAVLMSRLRHSLRAALFTDPDATRALIVTDRLMRLEPAEDFATALIALIDPVHGTISCASAGHPGPLIWEPGGTVSDPFDDRAAPLGLRLDIEERKPARTVTLRPESFVVFFTDGLLEWNRDVPAAMEALCSCMRRADVRDSTHSAKAIRDVVIGTNPHRDDIAILTVRVAQ
jgi:serine phosphatase RsbU (regulator of sigma subunit)